MSDSRQCVPGYHGCYYRVDLGTGQMETVALTPAIPAVLINCLRDSFISLSVICLTPFSLKMFEKPKYIRFGRYLKDLIFSLKEK